MVNQVFLISIFLQISVTTTVPLGTFIMMGFGMTRPGHEPTTYRVRGELLTTKPTRHGDIALM